MTELCSICGSGRMLQDGDDLICNYPRCGSTTQKVEKYHLHPQEKCNHCKVGRAILDNGEWVCNDCGLVLPLEEYISSAESDIPEKYTLFSQTPQYEHTEHYKHKHAYNAKPVKTPSVDREAMWLRNEYKIKIKVAICDITKALDLKPAKALSTFESRLKEVGMKLIVNRGQQREPNCVAAGLIYKVHRNEVTIRQLKKLSGCGNKSLLKILKIIG